MTAENHNVAAFAKLLQSACDLAFAALAMQCGCPPERLADLWQHMRSYPAPIGPGDAYVIFSEAVATLPAQDSR
jgi:hypothetical protein